MHYAFIELPNKPFGAAWNHINVGHISSDILLYQASIPIAKQAIIGYNSNSLRVKYFMKGTFLMATQEERITTLEQTFALFRKETASCTQEIEENTTIMLGIMRSQGQDIRKIFKHLEAVDEQLGAMDQHLETIDKHLERLETTFEEHTSLLTQILERLPI